MENNILNPELYTVLSDRFKGDIEVVNQGDPGTIAYTKKITRKGPIFYAHTETSSQEFRVNCPYCGDKRGRLYINYLAVSKIKHQGAPVRTYHLMNCRNDNCRMGELYKELKRAIKNPPEITVPKKLSSRNRVDLRLPAPNYLINSPKAHAGPVSYMTGRGFDLDVLANDYGVRTCDKIPGVEFLGQMILFPCYDGERLTFWQARMSHNSLQNSTAPKYYFPQGSNKSEVVYNRYHALTETVVVITEGVLDAIRVGKAGIACFGKHPSVQQTRIMSRAFKRKIGVLMLDPDAEKEAVKWYNKYKGNVLFEKGLFLCRLKDRDPAEHTYEELWDKIIDCIKEGTANAPQ